MAIIDPETITPNPSKLDPDRINPPQVIPQPTAINLTSKTFHGLKWSYVDTGINAVLQIGYTAVMSRLLNPADFGLVAMAGVVLRFGSYFAQMGMGSALVQKKDLSREDIRAGFTSSVLLSVLMFALIWTAAPLATFVFNNPGVVPIVRVMALSFILTGLSITAVSLLRRNLAFRSIAIIDIVSYILGYGGGGILLALKGYGIYSLVAAALSQSAILALLAFLFTRHSLSFIFEWKYYKRLYGFGGRVSVISFMEFISSNLDTMAIGHFLGAVSLGIYNRAFMLVNLPMQYLVTSFSRVLVPAYSRIQDETPRLKKVYLSSIMVVGSILVPICWGLSVASREAVLLILGEKWKASIPILQVLAFATPFNLLSHLAAVLLEATAKLKVKLFIQSIYICFLVVLFLFFSRFGVIGFSIAVVVGEFMVFVSYTFVTMQFLRIKVGEVITAFLPALSSGLIISLMIYGVEYFLRESGTPLWITFLAEIVVGGLLWIIVFVFFDSFKLVRSEINQRLYRSGFLMGKNFMVSKMLILLHLYECK